MEHRGMIIASSRVFVSALFRCIERPSWDILPQFFFIEDRQDPLWPEGLFFSNGVPRILETLGQQRPRSFVPQQEARSLPLSYYVRSIASAAQQHSKVRKPERDELGDLSLGPQIPPPVDSV